MRRTLFDATHDQYRASVRQFLAQEVAPRAEEFEQAGIVDREVFRRAGEAGFLGFAVPEAHGGGGVRDFRFNAILGEEAQAAGLASAGLGLTLHTDICLPYFLDLTTEEQKARWLPGIADGDAHHRRRHDRTGSRLRPGRHLHHGRRDGDHYVVNGSKTFITNGINADLVIVAVKTDPTQRHAGMSLLVVEAGMAGFERGRNLDKLGLHGQDTAELFFTDVRVPVANLLGTEGMGFRHLTLNLAQERLSIAVAGIAAARAVLDWTVAYTKERTAFGTPVGSFQNSKFRLAELATEVSVGQAYVDRCIEALNDGELEATDAADGQAVVHRVAGSGGRPRGAAARRLRLHARVPDRPGLHRRPHHPDLRRNLRDHEGDRGPQPRPLTASSTSGVGVVDVATRRGEAGTGRLCPIQSPGRAMRIGMFVAETSPPGSTVADLLDRVRWCEDNGIHTGWVPHVPWSLDGLTAVALAGQVTERIELGTAVVPTWSHHPYAMAQHALSAQAASNGRLLLGIGPSHRNVAENWYGADYDGVIHHVREYVDVLDAVNRAQDDANHGRGLGAMGGRVHHEGELYPVESLLGVPGAEPVPIYLAALAPLMLKLAGERADGTITWMCDEKAIETHVVPRLTAAAEGVGRPVPRVIGGLPGRGVRQP